MENRFVMERFKQLISEILKKKILQMMSANIVNKVLAMVSNMLVTRMLSVESFGMWSYILNVYSYLSLLSGLGLQNGAFQFGAEHTKNEKKYSYYKYCMRAGLLVNIFLTMLFIGYSFWGGLPSAESGLFIRLIAPQVLLEYIWNLMLIVLRCDNKIVEFARTTNVNTVLITIGTCVGAMFGIKGMIIGRYVAYFTSLVVTAYYIKNQMIKIVKAKVLDISEKIVLWKYSISLEISGGLNTLVYLLDVSMIAALITNSTEIALYKVATLIPSALVIIPNAIVTAVLPEIIYNKNDKSWLVKNIKKYILVLGIFNFFICGLLILFARLVIVIISGDNYIDAVPVFRVLVIGYFISGTFRVLSTNILAVLKYIKYNLFLSIIAGLCDISFNYIFIRTYGMIGAAYASLLTMSISAILAFGYLLIQLKGDKRKNI